MIFKDELTKRTEQIEKIIGELLPEEKGYQKTVIEAMNYSVNVGGKRLRPMFMKEVHDLLGGDSPCLPIFMTAIEMIHTYSLVHDDLPAMDNDEYRRGKKTTHVVYGEGMAVLAGDGLLNLAFETAAGAFDCARDEKEFRLVAKAMQVLSRKAGIYGMIGGQTADVESENKGEQVSEELLLFIHEHKTAALIQAAMMVGAILAGAEDGVVAQIEKCAYNIGIAFQIQDDILDVTSTLEELGKPIGSDEKNNKVTYVTLHGLEGSKEQVKKMSEEAIAVLSGFSGDNEFIVELVRQLIYRKK